MLYSQKKRRYFRKKQFDEANHEEVIQTSEDEFKVNYFLVVVDMEITSLNDRFEQMRTFENVFGFLYNLVKLKSLDVIELKKTAPTFIKHSLMMIYQMLIWMIFSLS